MTSGVTLHSNPTTLSGSYSYVYGPATGTYTVTNLGTVAATGNNFSGAVYLKLGGIFTNGSAADTSASVTGYGTNAGVAIVGAPGTITNFGSIDGGSAQRGVRLYDGGILVNGSPTDTTAVIRGHGLNNAVGIGGTTIGIPSGGGSGGGNGIVIPDGIDPPPVATVANYGTIGNSDAKSGVAFGTGAGVATVINGSTADTVALIISGSNTSTGTGIYIGGPLGGTIQNFATIGAVTARTGIYLGPQSGAVTITNGSTADTTALITGGTSGGAISTKSGAGPVDVLNYGTLSATTASTVYIENNGTVTNGSALDTTAVIQSEGTHAGVYVKYGVATITNYGTIGDAAGKSGLSFGSLGGSGTVINGSTADTTALIVGGPTGGSVIYFGGANGGTVVNFATIGGPDARAGISGGTAGGRISVTNGSDSDTTALITGGSAAGSGVASSNPAALLDVMNYGTIAGTAAAGIDVAGGGTITNGSALDTSALIKTGGTHTAIYTHGGRTTVVNYGTIGGTAGSDAVAFFSPAVAGTVINGSTADETALIQGGATLGNAINSTGPAVTVDVTNYGTIVGTASAAIDLSGGGTVTNGSALDHNAVIQAPGAHAAVYTKGGLTTIVNFGTLGGGAGGIGAAFGSLAGNGAVINGSTADTTALITSGTGAGAAVGMANPNSVLAVANYGTITSVGSNGVELAGGGTVTNGSAGDTVASIVGNSLHSAIAAQKFVTVANFGTISDPGPLHPVYATAGAMITNGSPTDTVALMSAIGTGVHVQGGATTLTNFGTIADTTNLGDSVYTVGGAITNGSTADTAASIGLDISGSGRGIVVYGGASGPITNFGTIVGYTGVVFGTAASLGTVINAGTIASTNGTAGVAINFANAGGVVIADPGAVFTGLVDASGNGGYGVLHLASGASTGTIDGIGYYFQGFGITNVDAGANWVLASRNTLSSGTSLTVQGTVSDSTSLAGAGTVELSGGTALLANGLDAPINVDMAASTVNTVAFQGSTGGTLSNLISGFATGDRIEVSNVTFNGAIQNGPALELTENGGTVFTLANVGFAVPATPNFNFGTDATTGFDFVELACFAAGTRLLTAAGEVPVEDMRAGMLVPSLTHGQQLRVTWVGTRHVDCAAHPRPRDVWPVRIAAHAFGPDAPHRDLLLSPDHAVALPDGRGGAALVPARYLLNGATVVQERHDSISDHHVELEHHGVLVAEGLAAESYLDTGNRDAFGNDRVAVMVAPETIASLRAR